MKLIIDIPDTTYAFVKQLQWVSTGRGSCKTVQQNVINAIKTGVPYEDNINIKLDNIIDILTGKKARWLTERDEKGIFYKCSNCGALYGDKSAICHSCNASMI